MSTTNYFKVASDLPMRRPESLAELLADEQRHIEGRRPESTQRLRQAWAFRLFQDKRGRSVDIDEVVDCDDIRMGEASRGPCLLTEASKEGGISSIWFANALESDSPSQEKVVRPVYSRHPALSPDLQHSIPVGYSLADKITHFH